MIISKDFNLIYSIKFDGLLKHIFAIQLQINDEFNYSYCTSLCYTYRYLIVNTKNYDNIKNIFVHELYTTVD